MLRFTAVAALCLFVTNIAAIRGAVFIPLGDLPGGAFHSEATRVSADGSTVVGWSMTDRGREAFRWTRSEGMTSLGLLPGGTQSTALGVSGDGSLIAGFADNSDANGLQAEAFYWTRDEGLQPMGFLDGGADSRARAISADGTTIVGGSLKADGSTEAFRWTRDGGLVGLGDLPGGRFASVAQNVSADGRVIVGYGGAEAGREAFWWTPDGGMIGLGDAEGGEHESAAWEIFYGYDPDTGDRGPTGVLGEVTVQDGKVAAMIGKDGNIDWRIGDLPGGELRSAAYGFVSGGHHSVGTATTDRGNEAFFSTWGFNDPYHLQPLSNFLSHVHAVDMGDWLLFTAVSATNSNPSRYLGKNGIIVGTGLDPDGNTQAWLVDLGRYRHTPLDGAYGWSAGPDGIARGINGRIEHNRGGPAPLEFELLSPEFEIVPGLPMDVSFTTYWQGSNGAVSVYLVQADAPENVLQTVASVLLYSDGSSEEYSRPIGGSIDPSTARTNTKYRLRIRYYDSDETSLRLGPVTLAEFQLTGIAYILPGDTNGDAVVDLVDLNNVRNNFGQSAADVAGDTNDDHVVDLQDLNNVRNNFGSAIGGANQSVPEPSTLGLAVLAAVFLRATLTSVRLNIRGRSCVTSQCWEPR